MKLTNLLCRNQDFRSRLEQNRDRLYRIAYSWCHEAALADDLVQETLEKALKKSGQLRDPAAMDTWLFTILNNCWRDHFRRSKETVDIDELPFVSDSSPEDEGHAHQVVHQVRGAIDTLPIGQRQVLTLVDLEGCSYIEVANILGVPVGTVMSRLCRARRALKARLLDSELLVQDNDEFQTSRIRRVK
ncbi:RNA polymerase sigma factor [Thiohalobacter sp. IOR34]|uniref:RNA polymerase sigma factor n=1 Tax=Thiohalobacter sp. IOR34 TaxID=3057176 RepID=UPI0025B04976|nr:RNA polymerase sigma factor [Thiohalobacter sp. IOR34]WJW75279.1 RNA polymerase sigma factor [Thiohalobacter sp. IOR34]